MHHTPRSALPFIALSPLILALATCRARSQWEDLCVVPCIYFRERNYSFTGEGGGGEMPHLVKGEVLSQPHDLARELRVLAHQRQGVQGINLWKATGHGTGGK